MGEHSHESEIRKRGLKLEKASKLLEAVEVVVPTSSNGHNVFEACLARALI